MYAQLSRVNDRCPIALMKSIKNDTEIAGMRSAHVSENWTTDYQLIPSPSAEL